MDVKHMTDNGHEEGAPCNSRVRPSVSSPVSSQAGVGGDLPVLASCPVAVVCPKSEPCPHFHDDSSAVLSSTSDHVRRARSSSSGRAHTWLGHPQIQRGGNHSAFACHMHSESGSGMAPCMIDEEEDQWLEASGSPGLAQAVGEGADRVHPIEPKLDEPGDVSAEGRVASPSEKLFAQVAKEASDQQSTWWLTRARDWMFPPMRSYEELCENVSIRALGFFHTDTWLRKACVYTVKSKAFERISLALILINCVFLALDSKDPDHPQTMMGAVLQHTEWFFMISFTVEMVLKILGLGLYRASGAYLRDGWNVVDCVVVVVGWLSLLPSIENISAMRSVRVLRPLRTITGVEGMRMLVATLLRSLPMLLDVLILCAFLFLIFGTIGVQTFSGALRQHCGRPLEGTLNGTLLYNVSSAAIDMDESCGDGLIDLPLEGAWFDMNGTSNPVPMSSSGRSCSNLDGPEYTGSFGAYCFVGNHSSNPNYGLTSFDNIFWSWLTIFQCVSLEGWTDIMYKVQDGLDEAVWVYFVVLITLGAFFAVNLALAVLYLQFTHSQLELEVEREDAARAAEAAEEARRAATAVAGFANRVKSQVNLNQSERSSFHDLSQSSQIMAFLYKIQKLCKKIEAEPKFEALTLCLICLNTVLMASEYHGMQPWHIKVNEVMNIILTTYFTLEMLIKVIGLGIKPYLSDALNVFDGAVAISSVAELVVFLSGGGRGTLSVFRAFRLMRVFKLARRWEELNKIVQTIFKSISSIAYLSLLLLVFIFIMALLGMQIFGYKFVFCNVPDSQPVCPQGMNKNDPCLEDSGCYNCPAYRDCYLACSESQWGTWISAPGSAYNDKAFCERFPRVSVAVDDTEWQFLAQTGKSYVVRHNFDTVYSSIVTIFQILTGENWNEVMYDGMRATNAGAALYFLFIVIIGNYVVLNLFLAILLEQFSSSDKEEDAKTRASAVDEESVMGHESAMGDAPDTKSGTQGGKNFRPLHQPITMDRSNTVLFGRSSRTFSRLLLQDQMNAADVSSQLEGHSLFIFGPTNPIRICLARIVWHQKFEQLIITLIVLSSIVLAIDAPRLDPNGTLKATLSYIDFWFGIMFTAEAAAKIVVYGLAFGKYAYIKSPWNILDFMTVVVGNALMIFGDEASGNFSSLKSLRTLRALRPIRMASRWPGMKVVVNALFQSIPASGNVLLVCFLFYIIFGIMFVSLLKGTFEHCQSDGERLDPEYFMKPSSEQTITQTWCEAGSHVINAGRSLYHTFIPPSSLPASSELQTGNVYTLEHHWVKPPGNFDHILNALLSLFEIATTEMWPDYMYMAVDATFPGSQPIYRSRPANALYFVIFIIVGSFFVLNLFVGVAIDKFNEMQAEHLGQNLTLTPAQEQWVTVQRMMAKAKPPRTYEVPENPYQAAVFRVVASNTFESIIMGLILINVACLAMHHVGMAEELTKTIFWLNVAFTIIFLMEVVVKLIGLGVKQYFHDRWCMFDFSVAMLSAAQIAIDVAAKSDVPAVNLLRVFRVVRVFRLVPKAKGLRTLLQTLVFSLPALVNVGSVLFLFMFIFAIMGMSLFGNTRYGEYLNRHANFDSFPSALLLLIRITTGESWNGIMRDCMIKTQCLSVEQSFTNTAGDIVLASQSIWYNPGDSILDGAPTGAVKDLCGPWAGLTVAYFILFMVLCSFLLLNLVIAVILDNFQNSSSNEELEVSQSNILGFAEVWGKLDPKTTLFIPVASLNMLLEMVEPPLGTAGLAHSQLEVQNIIMGTDIPIRNVNGTPHVQFSEVLHALAGRIAGCEIPAADDLKARAQYAGIVSLKAFEQPKYGAAHYHAALHVQAAVRGFLARHDVQKGAEENQKGGSDLPGCQ